MLINGFAFGSYRNTGIVMPVFSAITASRFRGTFMSKTECDSPISSTVVLSKVVFQP